MTTINGRLADNVVHFTRLLRGAGLPVGPGKMLDALRAVRVVGIGNREDFYWTLHAVLVERREQHELFDQAFRLFWRNPRLLEQMQSLLLPALQTPGDGPEPQVLTRRLAEALQTQLTVRQAQEQRIEFDASSSWSAREQLQHKDFEQMSNAELEQARALLQRLRLNLETVATRRYRADPRGPRVDLRATLRRSLRGGGEWQLARRSRRLQPPPLVLLCDISGSMARYARMLLHFAHTLAGHRERVHTFVFGTRLTNITRQLRYRDVDEALARVAGAVDDWSGGTRIGPCLHAFNRDWSRRVLGQGAVVLFVSDGLDRAGGGGLDVEMERLHKSCQRLVWLNPLLRYGDFQPRAQGIRAILPHVDELRAAHNVDSLSELAEALNRPLPRREEGVSQWLRMLS